MNLRQVVFWLAASVCVASTSLSLAQQVQIKGPKNATEQFSGTTYGPITSSDTLWRIANRYRQNKNVSVYQVMQAIYELNPDAFENNNFNLLKDGAILNLPSERYASRIDVVEARRRAERDDSNWNPATGTVTAPVVEDTPDPAVASKEDLSETKEVLEERLSALDQEQARQFAAIRQQFADSINNVQALLEDNQKLYERLSVVDEQIDGLRVRVDEELQLQMDQMLTLQNELLAISREADARRKAEMEASSMDWLTDPITLTLIISGFVTLSALTGFAIWMRRRKQPQAEEIAPLTPGQGMPVTESSAQLDDLSDALSDELSGGAEEDATDDDLFGEDDLLDDVLSEELQESLDEALEEELESFDDLDDEMLVPEADDKAEDDTVDDLFEDGDAVLEQGDLDNLFDEDDLLTDLDEDVEAIDLSDTEEEVADELSAADAELDSLLDEDDDLTEEIEAQSDALDESGQTDAESLDIDELLEAESAPSVSDVEDEDEKPEIDIDELLEQPQPALPESMEMDATDEVSEEMLQQLDQEIAAQNEELDNITDDLLNEIEQLEMMEGMLPPDDEEEPEESESAPTEQQHSIQTLDDLSEEIDDDATFDEQDALADDLLAELSDEAPSEAAESDPQDDLADELLAELGVAETEDSAETVAAESDAQPEPITPVEDDEDEVEASVDDLLEAYQETNTDEAVVEESLDEIPADDSDQQDEPAAPQTDDSADDDQTDSSDELIEQEDALDVDDIDALLDESAGDEGHDGTESPADVESASSEPEVPEALTDEPMEDVGETPDATEAEPLLEAVSEETQPETVDEHLSELDAQEEEASDIPESTDTGDERNESSAPVIDELADDDEQSEAESLSDTSDEVQSVDEIDELNELDDLSDDLLDAPEELDDDEQTTEFPEQESVAEPMVEEAIEAELEDEFDKALDDFEDEDDLEEFPDSTVEESLETALSEEPAELSLDDVPSFGEDIEAFDTDTKNSAPEEPSDAIDEPAVSQKDSRVSEDLDDVPGLGDWLEGDSAESDPSLEEIEAADFDELLESIDQESENTTPVTDELLDNPDLDLEALLTEDDSVDDIDLSLAEAEQPVETEEDFLDVDALLNESVDAEAEPLTEQDLDLDVSLEDFTGISDDDDVVDVDGDKGIGAQLDLARAYIEIEDKESAIEVLESVVAKGDDAQQAEATELLNALKT